MTAKNDEKPSEDTTIVDDDLTNFSVPEKTNKKDKKTKKSDKIDKKSKKLDKKKNKNTENFMLFSSKSYIDSYSFDA